MHPSSFFVGIASRVALAPGVPVRPFHSRATTVECGCSAGYGIIALAPLDYLDPVAVRVIDEEAVRAGDGSGLLDGHAFCSEVATRGLDIFHP